MATLIYDGEPYALASWTANDLRDALTKKLDDPAENQGSWFVFNDGNQQVLLLIRQGIPLTIRE
jgi:hypothetical protein